MKQDPTFSSSRNSDEYRENGSKASAALGVFGCCCASSCGAICTLILTAISSAPLAVFLWLVSCMATDPFQRWISFNLAGSRAIWAFAFLYSIFFGLGVFSAGSTLGTTCCMGSLNGRGRIIGIIWTFISLGILVAFCLAPYITARASKSMAWHGQCRGDWLTVELTGPGKGGATSQLDFSLSSTGARILTYQHTTGSPNSTLVFVAANTNSPVTSPVHSVTYDWTAGTISGECSDGTTCVSGTFNEDTKVQFNLDVNGTAVNLRGYDDKWIFDWAPFLDLRRAEDESKVVLQTGIHRCPKMKVCVPSSSPDAEVLGAEILVPLGWVAEKNIAWTQRCSSSYILGPYAMW